MGFGDRTRATLAYVAVLCTALAANAQTFTGAIVGRVVDSRLSAVAGASITLRSFESDFEQHTFANTQGEYAFELVPPGRFSVRAESSGFTPTTAIVDLEACAYAVCVTSALRFALFLSEMPKCIPIAVPAAFIVSQSERAPPVVFCDGSCRVDSHSETVLGESTAASKSF